MGFNMYKEIPKIKKDLKKDTHKNIIQADNFGYYLMKKYGLTKKTCRKWIALFEEMKFIKHDPVRSTIEFLNYEE